MPAIVANTVPHLAVLVPNELKCDYLIGIFFYLELPTETWLCVLLMEQLLKKTSL